MRWLVGILFLTYCTLSYSQVQSNVVLGSDSIRLGQEIDLSFKVIARDINQIQSLSLSNMDSVFVVYDPFAQSSQVDTLEEFLQIEITDYGQWPANEREISTNKLDWIAGPDGMLASINLKGILWQPGGFAIPGIAVNAATQSVVYGEPALLMIVPPPAYTPQDSTQFIADIKPIIEEPLKLEDFSMAIYGLGFLLLALCLWWLYNKYIKKEELEEVVEEEIIIRPAHELAEEKLDELKSLQLWQQGKIKEYQSSLTFIIREYLENRYEVKALESTTQEILKSLAKAGFDKTLNADLSEILTMADLVKFAKARPGESIHESFMHKAYDLIEQTKLLQTDTEDE